ncbi:MAG: hypothetical protein DRP79_07210 [Planctomycetota bacterium]|nr:MAG: hypothetical protein DRP79_07210 [Planctomycetota bacterium]
MNLVEQLEKNAREYPEKAAVIFRGCRMNYRELNDVVNRFAGSLLEMGLKKGDRVGLLLPRNPQLLVSFLATVKAGGIVVPINYELTHKDIRASLGTVSPLCLIVNTSFLDTARKSMPPDFQIPIIEIGDVVGERLLWNAMLAKEKGSDPCLDINDNDIVYLNYTSGSTGNPKGPVTTHSNIYWNTADAVDRLQLTPDDVHLCLFAPFAHPHEILARPLYLGGTMVLVDSIYPKSIAEAIADHKVTCMMGLAPMYENLLEVAERYSYDLSSLRVPESGGMYTHPDLIERFQKKVGVSIVPVWGSTETTGIALANRPGRCEQPGSVGKPCASYEVKLVDEDGVELPAGEVGEMVFKGPAVVKNYYENTISNQECFRDDWYYSGDLAKKDEENNFYFMGRKNGMMKVAGLKVYPEEIEQALMDHPDIKEVAVIPAKHKLRGEIPKAIIVTTNGQGLMDKDIRVFCRERLAHYKLPRIVELRKSLPKTGSGKTDKKALRSMYESIGG